MEQTLIPDGLHVIGRPPTETERLELLSAMAEGQPGPAISRPVLAALVAGAAVRTALNQSGLHEDPVLLARLETLARAARLLAVDHETGALLKALEGGYISPAPGGDLLRTPDILPTGRNLHGFDPFRLPSGFAVREGERQAAQVLDRHKANTGEVPRTVALVLWGTDNLKSEGAPIAQALALMGARPRLDSYGRVCGAELIPLADLKRPRIDVVMTLSGIFRDLLPLQTKMLAEAAFLAASAEEPAEVNFIRAHTLAHMASQNCDLETAALRVFSNADGTYGANVNQLIDSGLWQGEDELADAYEARKSFAYGRNGKPQAQGKLLSQMLAGVDLAYQNLDSLELGVTTIDHYVDTLGGISRAVTRARGKAAPVYICDQTTGNGQVRTLAEQVAVETHTRTLNARWYEGLLKHGYEGVRQIEAQITNTLGWSATTGDVTPWVYEQITQTYLLDPAMRERLASLNPKSSVRMANRLIEAHERRYWTPDAETLAALRQASAELEDRLEGVPPQAPPSSVSNFSPAFTGTANSPRQPAFSAL
jgi:magnesium chelatase subunit H